MFQGLKDWWNRDKIAREALDRRLTELGDRITSLQQEREAAEQAAQEAQAQLEAANSLVQTYRAQDEADRAKREGKDPWVEIKSADYSEVKGIQIELDWNEAFIQYLKDNGMKGRDDETIVQKWLAFLYQDLIERLENIANQQADARRRVNDSDYT